jgi:hypothetical protein
MKCLKSTAFEQVHQASGFGALNFVKTPYFMHYN